MEKIKFTQKFKNFYTTKKDYIIAVGAVFILFNIMLLLNGCFPYGAKTVALGDTLAQISAFLEHIFNVLQGKSTLFYTNYLVGGFEVFSTVQYMLLNPFYIIALLAGKNNIHIMLNFSVMFMFVFNAIVFVWFAKKYFPKTNTLMLVFIAILFAFSPYVSSNFGFVTWLIYPGILMLLIDKFLKLVNEGKILGFICIMVWYVCTCFSVGVSTNLILIVLFAAYIFFTKQKQERGQILVRLVVAYLIAVICSVVILFPSLMAFLTIQSRTSLLDTFFKVKYNNQTVSKLAFLVLPALFFVFAVYHLIKCDKKEGKNKFYIFAICFTAVILFFGMATELLTGGKCNGLYFRFGFIYLSVLFILMLEFFNSDYNFEPKEEKNFSLYKILLFGFSFICVFIFAIWTFLSVTKFSDGLKSIFVKSGFSWMTLFLVVCIIGFAAIVLLLRKKGLISNKTFKGFIVFAIAMSLFANFITVSLGVGTGYKFNDLRKSVSRLDENSKLKINSNNLADRNVNTMNLNVKNMSVFSSLVSNKMTESFENLGFLVSDVSVETTNSNLLADSLFGQKYVASYTKIDKPFLKLVSEKEDYFIYENSLVTTGAVVLDKNFEYNANISVYENYENLKELLGVEGQLFERVELEKSSVEIDKRYGKFVTKYTFEASYNTLLQINKKMLTLDRKDNDQLIEYFDELIGQENVFYVEQSSAFADSEMFYLEAGKSIEFYVAGVGNKSDVSDESIRFTALNYDVAKQVCEELQKRQVKVEYTKNGYKVMNNGMSGKLVIFNVDIDGMNYKVDGKKADAGHEFGYFAAFEVDENTKEIVAKYEFPHTVFWILIMFLGVAVIAAILMLYKKNKLKFMEKIIYYAFIVVNCCILLFFVGFGGFLTIFRILL